MKHKWIKNISLLALLIALLPSWGAAQTLEEILRDKGVITAEEYATATRQSSPAWYQPGKGITLATADGKYRATIGGWAHLMYSYEDADRNSGEDVSDFRVKRFKSAIQGHIWDEKLGYKYQAEISGGFVTEDAYLNYAWSEPLMVRFGQFVPPQARQELTPMTRQLFADHSLANDTFNLGRDSGLQLSGGVMAKRLEYRLGVFNGNGPNTRNQDNRMMPAGRIDLNPLGAVPLDETGCSGNKLLLNLGGSVAWEKIGPQDVGSAFSKDNDVLDVALNLDQYGTQADFTNDYGNDLNWLLWTTNLAASWKGTSFAAEYYALHADPQLGDGWDADGYYVQAGYMVIPKTLELGARYSAIKSIDDRASAKFDKSETQFAVNYYVNGHHLKLQSDVTLVKDDLNDDRDDTLFRLQGQFYF